MKIIWAWQEKTYKQYYLKLTKCVPSGSIWNYGFGKKLSAVWKPHSYLQKYSANLEKKKCIFLNMSFYFVIWYVAYGFALLGDNTRDICLVKYLTTLIN